MTYHFLSAIVVPDIDYADFHRAAPDGTRYPCCGDRGAGDRGTDDH